MYKIIVRILATWIKSVIVSFIGEEQSVFIEGRNIIEGPLIVNELCTWVKKIGKQMLLFKVDFNKAFDFVNWDNLDSIMEQMMFGKK